MSKYCESPAHGLFLRESLSGARLFLHMQWMEGHCLRGYGLVQPMRCLPALVPAPSRTFSRIRSDHMLSLPTPRSFTLPYSLLTIAILALSLTLVACDDDLVGDDPINGDPDPSVTANFTISPAEPDLGDEVTLDGSGSTVQNADELSFAWDLSTPADSDALLDDPDAEVTTFEADADGEYTVTLEVSANGALDSDSDSFDVSTVLEEEEISSDISEDRTLVSETLYTVTSRVDIEDGATLTIEPGTVIQFEPGQAFRVTGDASAIVAEGTAEEPITMTGTQEQDGWWRGIGIRSSNNQNILRHVNIAYAGGSSWAGTRDANVQLYSDASITLENVTSTHSGAAGLHVEDDAELPGFSNNTFTDNAWAATIPTPLMDAMDEGSSFVGNDGDFVLVESDDVAGDLSVAALDVPYQIQGRPDFEDGTLTIEPGAAFTFESDAAFRINGDAAAIIAEGTAEEPITMTGTQEQDGWWRGIGIRSSNNQNILRHVNIAYAGGDSWGIVDDANIQIYSDAAITLENVTSTHSGAAGLHVEDDADLPGFSQNTFTSNAWAATIPTPLMDAMDEGSSFVGNDGDYVLVESDDVSGDVTVAALDVPYQIQGRPDFEDGTLTIEPGAGFIFEADAGIRINGDAAAIVAEGTADDRITMTGVVEQPGHWRGIGIRSANSQNTIDYAMIEYAGGSSWGTVTAANVQIYSDAQLTLTNSELRNSEGWGAHARDSAEVTFSGNSYENNAEGDNNFGDE